jgi:hypothetical protein
MDWLLVPCDNSANATTTTGNTNVATKGVTVADIQKMSGDQLWTFILANTKGQSRGYNWNTAQLIEWATAILEGKKEFHCKNCYLCSTCIYQTGL